MGTVEAPSGGRLASIDALRGAVMVLSDKPEFHVAADPPDAAAYETLTFGGH